ncbi:MAG: hypothetical protein CMJ23_04030 [Phycisphaerae bacterium]|nr:hypothetical protein [Phycisphaerae bacterium]
MERGSLIEPLRGIRKVPELPKEWYEDVAPGVRLLRPPGVGFDWFDVVLDRTTDSNAEKMLVDLGLTSEIIHAAVDPDHESMRLRHLGTSLLRLDLPARILVDTDQDYLLSIVRDGERLLTIRRHRIGIVEDACAGIVDRDSDSVSARSVMAELGDEFLDRLAPTLRHTANTLDSVEADGEGPRADRVERMTEVRRVLLGIDRHLDPLQSAIQRSLLDATARKLDADLDPLRGLQDRANWLEHRVHGQLDRVRVLSDREHVLAMDDLSTSMYRLSWIATIFLPLTFVTGLLGINVGGIPFANEQLGFWFVCGVLLLIAAGTMVTLFLVIRAGNRRKQPKPIPASEPHR